MKTKKLIAISLAVILPLSAIKAADSSGISVGATNPYGGTVYYGGGGLTDMQWAMFIVLCGALAAAASINIKRNTAEPQGNDQVAQKPPTAQR